MKALSARHYAIAALLFSYVVLVNGALPGLGMPTLGQAIWLGGFAKSFGDLLSIYAHDIGLPQPAPLVFGLPGALPMAVLMKVGLNLADAYATICLLWIGVAFWGAYKLARHYGLASAWALISSTIWLTLPVVWQHAGYGMLYIGIALLPTYIYSVILFFDKKPLSCIRVTVLFAAFIVALFMDGYSFMMFCAFSALLMIYQITIVTPGRPRRFVLFRVSILFLAILCSYILYTCYIGRLEFSGEALDFYRGWGADISFLAAPTKGILLIPDRLGLSVKRQHGMFFGDEFVYRTTFSIFYIFVALAVVLCPYGDRRLKILFFVTGLLALYMSLGPSFKFNALRAESAGPTMPAKYALGPTGTGFISEYVPGFKNMRASYRWIALAFFGFWGVAVIAVVDKHMPRAIVATIAIVSLAINVPHMGRLVKSYIHYREQFLRIDGAIMSIRGDFPAGGTVAFMPYGNDFLVDYIAPRIGIRTFNIGGDKNVALARFHWPHAFKAARWNQQDPNSTFLASPAFASYVSEMLIANHADAVALPYINLLKAAYIWPTKIYFIKILRTYASLFKTSPLFKVREDKYFAIIRLNENLRALDLEERRAQFNHAGFIETVRSRLCSPYDRGHALAIGARILINSKTSSIGCVLGKGWSNPEKWGTWTNHKDARIYLALKDASKTALNLTFGATAYSRTSRQTVAVYASGLRIGSVAVTVGSPKAYTVTIPKRAIKDRELAVEFRIEDPVSPQELRRSADARRLGLGLLWLRLEPANSD